MSFLNSRVTLTPFPLTQSARFPHPCATRNFNIDNLHIHIELYNLAGQARRHITSIRATTLYTYLPFVSTRIIIDRRSGKWILPIYVPSTEHAADIEIPALLWLFQQMNGVANCLPVHKSIGQGVLIYRALQLLGFEDAATLFRPVIMEDMYTTPLKSYDVQRVWWAFQRTDEWDEWLQALIGNLARFDVYQEEREGDYIRAFIESEMMQLSRAEQERILRLYHRQKNRPGQCWHTKMEDWGKWAIKYMVRLKRWHNDSLASERFEID